MVRSQLPLLHKVFIKYWQNIILWISKEIGKPTGNDMTEGKLTLPVIYALKSTGDEEMLKLARKVKARTVSREEIAQLVAFTKENGGIEYADKRMWDFHAEAMTFLDTYVEDNAGTGDNNRHLWSRS